MLAKRYYWVRAGVVTLVAYVLGAGAYVATGILLAQGEVGAAGAGWHQVSVQAQLDDMVLKFAPERPARGVGDAGDPFVVYNSRVRMVVGVVGVGRVTVEDHNGNVLWEMEKMGAGRLRASAGYEEYLAEIELVGGVGDHHLSVKLNGVSALGPNVQNLVHFSYRAVPIPPENPPASGDTVPGVPNTGGGSVWYVAGYGVRTTGVLWSGGVVGLMVLLWFVVVALRRGRAEARLIARRKVTGRKIRREISAGGVGKVR